MSPSMWSDDGGSPKSPSPAPHHFPENPASRVSSRMKKTSSFHVADGAETESLPSSESSSSASHSSSSTSTPSGQAWVIVGGPKPWWVLYPHNRYRQAFELFMMIPLLYIAFMAPYRIFFDSEAEPGSGAYIWEAIVYAGFVTDAFLNLFCFAYQDGDSLVVAPRRIAWNYARTWLVVDLVACLPFDYIPIDNAAGGAENASDPNGNNSSQAARLVRIPRVLRLLRLLRLAKLTRVKSIRRHLRELSMGGGFGAASWRLLMTFFWSTWVVHIAAGVWWFIGNDARMAGSDNWIQSYPGFDGIPLLDLASHTQYLASIYYIFSTYIGLGLGDIKPANEGEMFFTLIAMVAGVVWSAALVSQMASLVAELDKSNIEVKEKQRALVRFAHVSKLPRQLTARILQWYERADAGDAARASKFSQNAILDTLPPPLRREVILYTNRLLIAQIPLLARESAQLQAGIVENLRRNYAVPGEVIATENAPAETMYFLVKGSVRLSQLDDEIAVYGPGSYFGEIDVLFCHVRIVSVQAVGSCEYYALTRDHLLQVCTDHPAFGAHLRRVAVARLKKYGEALGEPLVSPAFLMAIEAELDAVVEEATAAAAAAASSHEEGDGDGDGAKGGKRGSNNDDDDDDAASAIAVLVKEADSEDADPSRTPAGKAAAAAAAAKAAEEEEEAVAATAAAAVMPISDDDLDEFARAAGQELDREKREELDAASSRAAAARAASDGKEEGSSAAAAAAAASAAVNDATGLDDRGGASRPSGIYSDDDWGETEPGGDEPSAERRSPTDGGLAPTPSFVVRRRSHTRQPAVLSGAAPPFVRAPLPRSQSASPVGVPTTTTTGGTGTGLVDQTAHDSAPPSSAAAESSGSSAAPPNPPQTVPPALAHILIPADSRESRQSTAPSRGSGDGEGSSGTGSGTGPAVPVPVDLMAVSRAASLAAAVAAASGALPSPSLTVNNLLPAPRALLPARSVRRSSMTSMLKGGAIVSVAAAATAAAAAAAAAGAESAAGPSGASAAGGSSASTSSSSLAEALELGVVDSAALRPSPPPQSGGRGGVGVAAIYPPPAPFTSASSFFSPSSSLTTPAVVLPPGVSEADLTLALSILGALRAHPGVIEGGRPGHAHGAVHHGISSLSSLSSAAAAASSSSSSSPSTASPLLLLEGGRGAAHAGTTTSPHDGSASVMESPNGSATSKSTRTGGPGRMLSAVRSIQALRGAVSSSGHGGGGGGGASASGGQEGAGDGIGGRAGRAAAAHHAAQTWKAAAAVRATLDDDDEDSGTGGGTRSRPKTLHGAASTRNILSLVSKGGSGAGTGEDAASVRSGGSGSGGGGGGGTGQG
jgi:CRP-like cAMP-binding protein